MCLRDYSGHAPDSGCGSVTVTRARPSSTRSWWLFGISCRTLKPLSTTIWVYCARASTPSRRRPRAAAADSGSQWDSHHLQRHAQQLLGQDYAVSGVSPSRQIRALKSLKRVLVVNAWDGRAASQERAQRCPDLRSQKAIDIMQGKGRHMVSAVAAAPIRTYCISSDVFNWIPCRLRHTGH